MSFADEQQTIEEKSSHFWDLQCHDIVETTNAMVRKAAYEKAPEGLCIAALQQTGGYGRQGRVWSSPKGGLYVSFLVRPQLPLAQRSTLSLVASLAVRDALVRVCGLDGLQVKWPNDIIYDGAKVAGINLEAVGEDALILGIGINVFHPSNAPVSSDKYRFGFLSDLAPEAFPDAEPLAASTALTEPQRQGIIKVLISLLKELEADYLCWSKGGFDIFRDEYGEVMASKGKLITLEAIDGSLLKSGIGCGVDSSGHLLLRNDQGVVEAVVAGEVHIISTQF